MSHQSSQRHPCDEEMGTACGQEPAVRNRYFTGKFLTARDFQIEQEYFLGRHRLHNRLFHDKGILCGLRVQQHPTPECRQTHVVITPGIALDCCGRELIVPSIRYEPITNLAELMQQNRSFLLLIRYIETDEEYVPALYSDPETLPSEQEANRTREGFELFAAPYEGKWRPYWRVAGEEEHYPCQPGCDEDDTNTGSCVDLDCPGEPAIALALITPRVLGEGQFTMPTETIDLTGRFEIAEPPHRLTKIVDMNWQHGELMTLDHLRDDMRGQLRLRFNRRLKPETFGSGINALTFSVEVQDTEKERWNWRPLDSKDDTPPRRYPWVQDDKETLCDEAVFVINDDELSGRRNLAGSIIRVTLKCDFILDSCGRPVDGDFLGGKLPTGNGTPGGIFESWFFVQPEEHPRKQPKPVEKEESDKAKSIEPRY